MVTRGPKDKSETKCIKCFRVLPTSRFLLYTYQPVKNGQPVGDKIKKRSLNCKDCKKDLTTSKVNDHSVVRENSLKEWLHDCK